MWKHRKNRNDKSATDFDYEAWKRKHTAFADKAVPEWVKVVIERYRTGNTQFVCVGYCFGAPYVCDELAKGTVTAGAFAHPAFLKEHHFKKLKSKKHIYPSLCLVNPAYSCELYAEPLFLSCSEVDHTFDSPSRRRALDILQAEKATYHYQLFSGVEHGFALRGNPDDPYEREFTMCREMLFYWVALTCWCIGWVKEQSHAGIVGWFNYWISQENV